MEKLIFNIYHNNCNDGVLSAAITYKHCEDNNIAYEGYPMNYNDDTETLCRKLDLLSQSNKIHVIFTDFSLPKHNIEELCTIVRKVTILDHHATARDHLESLEHKIDNLFIYFDMNYAGCELTWNYFNNKSVCRAQPDIVTYIGDRDLWKFDYPETKPLTAVIRSRGMSVETWAEYLDDDYDLEALVQEGEVVEAYLESEHTTLANKLVDNVPKQYPIVTNLTEGISEVLNKVVSHKNYKHKFAVSYKIKFMDPSAEVPVYKLVYSVRSIDNESARKVAEMFHGGGHPNASGFESDLFRFPTIIEELNKIKL